MTRRNRHFHRDPTSWSFAIASSQPFSHAQATATVNIVRVAWQRLRDGTCEAEHFLTVGCAINLATVRAEQIGGNRDALETLGAAGIALNDAQSRRDERGRYGLTGPQLQAVGEAINVYEVILRASSPRQMHLAEREVLRRMSSPRRRGQTATTTGEPNG